ncbi:sugar transferase [Falsirhodobacter sp. 20TX0035]|uniref:sugar transferase n=1 Tax=Falsirhodobacter sp. 20TX0035 TaxID=3022019 RepID=UPI00232EDADC|nr:sugar transferase [Falsirhodobacter sp. 20TX0035]MDB6452831.1 sugar transferase [Falsirhodobacter sp. 20TX0035]
MRVKPVFVGREASLGAGAGRARLRLYRGGGKRAVDVALCLLLLPVILPVILCLWLLVRLDGGPGFFIQPRVGLGARVFPCWKLRTMVVDAEAALQRMCDSDPVRAQEWLVNQKLMDDPRITPLGRLLRATSLDELPQIFNVLTGDMSFVGPRPFLKDQEALYRAAGGRVYFRMRPGITGLWQVEGRNATTFVARVQYDARYFRNLGLRQDFGLLVKTAMIVVKRTGH